MPILEQKSGLVFNQDFYCGYSPERINPGDKKHRITTIKKVTSGSTPEIALKVDELYKEIIVAVNPFSLMMFKKSIKEISNSIFALSKDFPAGTIEDSDRRKIKISGKKEMNGLEFNNGFLKNIDNYYFN